MGNPTLLLLDEPLEGLAPVIVDLVLNGIERLRREDGLGFLLVEQHARLALGVTERAIILDRGTVVHAGPSAPLLSEPERLASLMGVSRRAG
jgi:branched-chain amino acid transport system ATP-binding protein